MPFGQGRSGGGGGGRGRAGDKKPGDKEKGQRRTLFRRRKVCKFCADKIDDINYKDVKLIGPFVPERGKILPRRISGTCAMHQRKLQTAIKRARQIALAPDVRDGNCRMAGWQYCRKGRRRTSTLPFCNPAILPSCNAERNNYGSHTQRT